MTGILLQRSTHAWSSATGSNEASMPTFGIMGTSFSAWQSQNGETSQISEMWNAGRSLTTAYAYSAILHESVAVEFESLGTMASLGQTARHLPQPTHLLWSITDLPFTILGPQCAHIRTQDPHPIQFSPSTTGLPSQCCSILPEREPLPIPRFFRAPPKPASSWPLK